MSISRIIGMANEAFAEKFTEIFKDNTYSLILGNKDETTKGVIPAKGSYASSINSFYGDFGVVLPEKVIYPVTIHHKWARRVHVAWDSTKNQTGQGYYCEHKNKVYICVDNNNGAISGVPPSGTSTKIFTTEDRYRWKYLYTISGVMNQYKRNLNGIAWMPVQPRLLASDRNKLSATDPYWIKYNVEKDAFTNQGELIRIVVQDEMRKVRFIKPAEFEPVVDPINSAKLLAKHRYIGKADEVDENLRDFQLISVEVVDGGSKYPAAVSLKLDREPTTGSQNTNGYDSDIIVGGDTSNVDTDIKGPFVYGISAPDWGDAVGLLGAYRSMFLAILDPRQIKQYTDSTSWNTAAIVENALYNNKPMKETFPFGQGSAQASYFSSATIIKTNAASASAAFASGNKLSSIAASGNNRRISATISSNKLDADNRRVISLVGEGTKNISVGDTLFKEQSNTSLVSNAISFAKASTKVPTAGSVSVTVDDVKKTPLSFGKDTEDRYTKVIHTFEFNSISLASADAGTGLAITFLVG